jgi:hypothetical protein
MMGLVKLAVGTLFLMDRGDVVSNSAILLLGGDLISSLVQLRGALTDSNQVCFSKNPVVDFSLLYCS